MCGGKRRGFWRERIVIRGGTKKEKKGRGGVEPAREGIPTDNKFAKGGGQVKPERNKASATAAGMHLTARGRMGR